MWLLVSQTAEGEKYPIVGDKKYVVGRIGCDITINDPSVSRKQAVLSMTHSESNVVKSFMTPILSLEDTSKFGTYVNGKTVRSNGGHIISLKDGDEIQFGGSPASKFKATYEPFIATTSCLEKAPKKTLQKIMCLLGGHVVRDWRNNCDLLIMSKINVTIKVICAINNQKHIVTPVYLDHYHKHLLGQREKPDPVDYLPEVVDKEVPPGVSFHPDIRRVTLLSDLKFYFLSAVQFNKTNLAVSTAGGLPILLEDGTDEDAETMTKEGTIVVSVSREVLSSLSATCQKFVRSVCAALKRKNLRMVTDPEIGWAILTCNTNDFCNPKSAITPSMYSSMASQSLSQLPETEATQQTGLPTTVQPPATRSQRRPGDSLPDSKIPAVEQPQSLVQQSFDPASTESPAKKPRTKFETQAAAPASCVSSNTRGRSPSPPVPHTNGSSSPSIVQSKRNARLEFSPSSKKDQASSDSARKSPAPKNSGDHGQSPLAFPISAEMIEDDNDDDDEKEVDDKGADGICSVFNKDLQGMTGVSSSEKLDSKRQRSRSPSAKKSVGAVSKEGQKNGKIDDSNFLLVDSDDEEPSRNNKKTTPQKKSKVTPLFIDSDESPPPSRKRKKEVSLFGSDDEDTRVSPKKNKMRQSEAGGGQTTDSSVSVDIKDIKTFPLTHVKVEESPVADQPETPDHNALDDVKPWLTDKTEVKSEHGLPIKQETENAEVFLNDDGQPVHCIVKVVGLVAKQPLQGGSQVKRSFPSMQPVGMKNFKKFKKTQHTGMGKLPRIIGGSDLQPYIGNKLQALDGLLTEERLEKRQTNQRQDQLFGWDDDQIS